MSPLQLIESLNKRMEEAVEIERIGKDTLPLLEEIRANVTDQARVNKAIAKIDALRARMNAVGATYDLITQLTQATEMQRFESDRHLAAAKVDAIEKQRRQVDRDILNVVSVKNAAQDFQKLLAETIESLKQNSEAA